ncbi:hypothetical protein PFISCL1PPCAC_381, partial [Pristionchus fissidentatus]
QWLPDHDPRDERGEFESRAQYLLTVIGFTLGNGNFWHLPLAVRHQDGASFLIMYFICMAVFGVPVLYMEMMIGQIAQVGPMRAFQLYFPLLQGVGWAVCLLSYVRAINFSLLNAFSLDFAVESLIGVASRTLCTNSYNTPGEYCSPTNRKFCKNQTQDVYYNKSCISLERRLTLMPAIEMPAREFFRDTLRGIPADFDEGIDQESSFEFGSGRIIVCFCIVWLFASFCLLRRMRWLGKLSLFIVGAAGVMTVIIGIRALSLPRAYVGIQKFFHIRTRTFANKEAWQSAIGLVRSSLCLGLGGMISMASYNKRTNDAFWPLIIIGVIAAIVKNMKNRGVRLNRIRSSFSFHHLLILTQTA